MNTLEKEQWNKIKDMLVSGSIEDRYLATDIIESIDFVSGNDNSLINELIGVIFNSPELHTADYAKAGHLKTIGIIHLASVIGKSYNDVVQEKSFTRSSDGYNKQNSNRKSIFNVAKSLLR